MKYSGIIHIIFSAKTLSCSKPLSLAQGLDRAFVWMETLVAAGTSICSQKSAFLAAHSLAPVCLLKSTRLNYVARAQRTALACTSALGVNKKTATSKPATAQDISASSIVMEPIREADVDVLVVFAPGALTAATEYIPLANEIQSSSNHRLWVVILNPPDNIILTETTEGSFDGVLERVKSLGFRAGQLAIDNVFIAGHSWGAWTSRTVALRRAQGFIQMGSCFHTNPDNLAQYPKPVLTLCGELDGQVTLAAIAKHAGEVFDVEPEMGCFNTYGVKPVIIVPGMNHAQFSHGTPNKTRGDLDAEITIETARSIAGGLIAAFLTVQVEGPKGDNASAAFAKLEEAVTQTHAMCGTYWEAISSQGKNVKKYQLEVAKLPPQVLAEEGITIVQHDYLDNFIYSKPWIDSEQQPAKIFVQTYLNPYGKYGIMKNLWIKMKSQEAAHAALSKDEDSSAADAGTKRLAAEFNEKTFAEALELVPVNARKKYLDRGRKPRFLDDLVITGSAVKWIESDVTVNPSSGVVDVQSPVIISPLQGIAPRFAGMHYMKLVTLAGAMQWILIDCYRD